MEQQAQFLLDSKDRHIYTVAELTRDIKIILENTFSSVWVSGEVSNFRLSASGHAYFSLKDEEAVLQVAIFASQWKTIKFKIEDGMKLICFGRIDVYEPRGQYQLIVEKVEPQGIGARQLAFEQLKKKLAEEGLFNPERKKPLPLMPWCIGIVTSAQGAAVRDILGILKKGAPGIDVIIRDVRVQGERSAAEIEEAIADLNKFGKVDVIIISRGGGSIEDLWSFNEERVARAIFNSRIPTISAVGHQINTTLSDMVADVFVETPSAAAKLIVDKRNTLVRDIEMYMHQLYTEISEIIYTLKNKVVALAHMLKSPLDRLQEKLQFLDELTTRLNDTIGHILELNQQRLKALIEKLEALSPLAILSRGYSVTVRMKDGQIVREAKELGKGDTIKTILHKGMLVSRIEEVKDDGERETEF